MHFSSHFPQFHLNNNEYGKAFLCSILVLIRHLLSKAIRTRRIFTSDGHFFIAGASCDEVVIEPVAQRHKLAVIIVVFIIGSGHGVYGIGGVECVYSVVSQLVKQTQRARYRRKRSIILYIIKQHYFIFLTQRTIDLGRGGGCCPRAYAVMIRIVSQS